ncbi:hypothetical protein, partial [Alcanivorax xiamenensis]|uniref:hypothetical protein n=1 Tax=Alcanivorax xiamenensis TaxID=1177156 RepID=UPI001F2727A0
MDGGHKKLPGAIFNVARRRLPVFLGYLEDTLSEVATALLWEEARVALRLVANALGRWRFACQQASHSGAVA